MIKTSKGNLVQNLLVGVAGECCGRDDRVWRRPHVTISSKSSRSVIDAFRIDRGHISPDHCLAALSSLRMSSMTDAAWRKAVAETMVGSKSLARSSLWNFGRIIR